MAKKREHRGELAGAAALAGAMAVGGKVAWDRFSWSHASANRGFCLRLDEPVADGVRRIADTQLEDARAELSGAPQRRLSEAVHDTRKRLKRLRATVRLARGGLGDELYRYENTAFRDTGRRLAGVRDAAVLIETLDKLERSAHSELPAAATAALRARLKHEREQALTGLQDDRGTIDAVIADLDGARARAATWPLQPAGFDALEPGLRRIYRRGRRAMRRAAADPRSENLHEWRKRVKDLWHAIQVLRLAAPKRMSKLAKRSHDLSDLLGDDHDLAELRRYAIEHRQCFDDRPAVAAVMRAIDRRRTDLQRQALELGSAVYSQRPKRFTRGVARRWAKRCARAA